VCRDATFGFGEKRARSAITRARATFVTAKPLLLGKRLVHAHVGGKSVLDDPWSRETSRTHDDAMRSLAVAQRRAITRRLTRFSAYWLCLVTPWHALLVAQGRVSAVASLIVFIAQALLLLLASGICLFDPGARRVIPVTLATCVLAGTTATALFAHAGASGDVTAFILLTLYLTAALFFAWGWRMEAVLLGTTSAAWLLAIPRFEFHTPPAEIATAIVIGATLSLVIAEGAARSFRLAFQHQANEKRARRALELARDEAVQARAEAEAATKAKDEFLATVSHELRSPIGAVLNWTGILQKGAQDRAQVHRAVDIIERSARAQARLLEDLLDVSRIVSGKMKIEMGAADLREVVSSVADTARSAAEAKRLTLEVEPGDEPVFVRGDAARLAQVVDNIIGNAVKFTPDGGRVTLSLARTADHAEIRVTDTGIGIPPDRLGQVFERFTQAHRSSARHHGLGLGLSIARHLVVLHGGTIEASSGGAGCGATFRVVLPLDAGAWEGAAGPSGRETSLTPGSFKN
jgi:signal transduction histidine kinase